MNDTPAYAQAAPQRKSRRKWWIAGILLGVVVLLGTCIKGGMDLFAALGARTEATEEFVRKAMKDGLPPADDPIYARRAGVTQEQVDASNRYVKQFGAVSDFSAAVCQINSSANIDPTQSGTFGDCSMTASSEHSPVNIYVGWVREDEVWKIFRFDASFTDQTVLIEKAEEFDRRTNEEGGPAEEPPPDNSNPN
jgi:hypothetical protein